LRGASLRVKKGEFVCLIGASGCGKIDPAAHGRRVRGCHARRRPDVGMPISGPGPGRGMLFQDYGLFPWLNVRDNIGFGPKSEGADQGRNPRDDGSFHRTHRFAEFC
jgi:NitT/TauT family transport system ATP-binding protein